MSIFGPDVPLPPKGPRRTGANWRANHALRELARENYPADVLLYPCPRCNAKATRWCRSRSSRPRAVPHEERVKLARLR